MPIDIQAIAEGASYGMFAWRMAAANNCNAAIKAAIAASAIPYRVRLHPRLHPHLGKTYLERTGALLRDKAVHGSMAPGATLRESASGH